MGSSQTEDRACVSCIGTWILYQWATREAPLLSLKPVLFVLWQNPNFQSPFVGVYLDSPTSIVLDVWIREQPCYTFCSVTKSCPTLCDPMDCSTPGFPVLHHFLELAQTCPLSQWCHPTLSSFVIPFCFQSFPTSGSFLMSQLFTSGGQGIGASASASVLLMNIQDWFPLGLTGLISLQSKGLSSVFNTTAQKHLSPWIGLNSCSLSQWCYLTISSSAAHSPFAFSLLQHQGLFQWVGCLHLMAKVLELQYQSFQ